MIRTARTAHALLPALAGAVLLALTAAGPAAAGPATATPGQGSLTVIFHDGRGHTVNRSLSCHPAGGSMPGAAQACRRLDALNGPVGAAPQREMCSMLYGGPQTARVTGTWRGRRVDESYNRTNGCQTERWNRMEPVLPAVVAGSTALQPRS